MCERPCERRCYIYLIKFPLRSSVINNIKVLYLVLSSLAMSRIKPAHMLVRMIYTICVNIDNARLSRIITGITLLTKSVFTELSDTRDNRVWCCRLVVVDSHIHTCKTSFHLFSSFLC